LDPIEHIWHFSISYDIKKILSAPILLESNRYEKLVKITGLLSYYNRPLSHSEENGIPILFQFTFWKYTNDFFKFLFSFKNMHIISLFSLSYMFIAISELPISLYFFLLNV